MDKATIELLKQMHEDIKGIRNDVDDLKQWKSKLTGVFIAISCGVTFVMNCIKYELFNKL